MTSEALRLDVSGLPAELARGEAPEPGDIFSKAGGQPGFWWIIDVKPNGDCYALAFDTRGSITGANRYAASYFWNNMHRRVGFAALPAPVVPEWVQR